MQLLLVHVLVFSDAKIFLLPILIWCSTRLKFLLNNNEYYHRIWYDNRKTFNISFSEICELWFKQHNIAANDLLIRIELRFVLRARNMLQAPAHLDTIMTHFNHFFQSRGACEWCVNQRDRINSSRFAYDIKMQPVAQWNCECVGSTTLLEASYEIRNALEAVNVMKINAEVICGMIPTLLA